MRRIFLFAALAILCGATASSASDDVATGLLLEATAAVRAGKQADAIRLISAALAAAPKNQEAYRLRAALYSSAGEHQKAIDDYSELVKLDPDRAEFYDERGSQHFMAGHVDESIADFDRYLKLRPAQEPWHWKRGISYYYAGRYDDGRKQFEGYQTVDDNDVENAVWRYLCMARSVGVPAARDAILKIKDDRRVPMREVYDLYSGKAQPDAVLTAARAGSPAAEDLNARLFYAHLYLGLYCEVAGDTTLARQHLKEAVDHKIGHYMWNVAQVHAERLKPAGR